MNWKCANHKAQCLVLIIMRNKCITGWPSDAPRSRKKKKKLKRATKNETLICPSAVRAPHTLTPPPARQHGGFYRGQAALMNIHGVDATGDATEFAEISAKKSPRGAQQWGCTVAAAAAVLLFTSRSDIPPAHAHPNVETLAYTHARAHTHWHPPTYFYVYKVWLLNTGIHTEPHAGAFFLFLVWKVIWLTSWQTCLASARRRVSPRRSRIIWE